MDEIPPAAAPTGDPVPLSWPVAEPGAKGLRKIPRRALTISIATTALVVIGGAVVAGAVAAAPNGNGTPSPVAPGQSGPGPMMQNGNRAHMAGPMQAVHGEYTVPNGNGGYQTEEMQRGSVTAVNGSTFTVKSEDGYTHDWVTDANTRMGGEKRMRMMPKNNNGTTQVPAPTNATNAGLTTGQNVMVMGTKDGDTFHAVQVMPMRQADQNQNAPLGNQGRQKMPYRGGGGGQFGPRGGMQNGPMQSAPMPQNGPMQSGPMQSAPVPDQTPSAPDSSPTPTQAS
jgi:hypothetical protein